MPSGPLSGVRVLEFAQVYAGPFAAMMLADMGAEVIKVEAFDGDPWRHHTPYAPSESPGFHVMNRGKQSIALDLKRPEGLAVIDRLLPGCDVLVTNLRQDVPKRLGIDYERVQRFRPDIIYALGTAWGRQGPDALDPAFDLIAVAASGLMASAGRVSPRGNPITPGGTAYVDYYTGYSLALAICAALFHRAQTGQGQLVETSMLANSLMIQNASFSLVPAADKGRRAALKGELEAQRGRGASFTEQSAARRPDGEPLSPFYRTYLTRDGAIAVGGLSAPFRAKMRKALGIAESEMPAPNDAEANDTLRALMERIECQIRELPTAHWVQVFKQADVPVTPVNFVEEMDTHPQVQSNGYTVEVEHPTGGRELQVGPVHQMSATPPAVQGPSPMLGEHTRRVLALAGYSAQEIDQLFERDVVREPAAL